jgi:hypothetical protein
MSAFVVIFTREGFTIAADGKLSADESTLITDAITARLAHSVEKIYVGPDNKFGYFLTGFVEDEVTGFDLTQALHDSLLSTPSDSFHHYFYYVRQVALKFKALIVEAQAKGLRFPEWPEFTEGDTSFATEVGVAGYFKDVPFSVHFKITHVRQSNLALTICPVNALGVGYKYESASHVLPNLTLNDDARFVKYKEALLRPFQESLEDAAEYSKGLIALCSDPLAAEVDSVCKGIGGHIHIADVTPEYGFRWRIPPLEKHSAACS